MAAIPSSGSLMATHYHRRCLGSTSRSSSCRSTECPAEAIPHHPASFLESPPSRSWPWCWSLQSTRNPPPPGLPQRDHLWPGSEHPEEAAQWSAQHSQLWAAVLT
ncbi:pancreatic progenitor cell differentiation and proliferation factor-like [Callithrix jacchus]|uniref:pancreatic progenitor cell differentiation and proliferation factor-like n=1 Tax=Callithrix jacchus TaxID=9483 RepID=UPI00159E0904|nr:pancreatic progenitor cell differentiation and proliferation factor-like [Callithrix jacchus]